MKVSLNPICALCNKPLVQMTCRECQLLFPKAPACEQDEHTHWRCQTEHLGGVPVTIRFKVRPR